MPLIITIVLKNLKLQFLTRTFADLSFDANKNDLNANCIRISDFSLLDIEGLCSVYGDIKEIEECFSKWEFKRSKAFIKIIKFSILLLKLLVKVIQRQRQFIEIFNYKNIGLIFKNMDDNSGANYFDHFTFDQNTIFHFNKNYLYDNHRIYKFN